MWFSQLFGFAEAGYEETQARFRLEGDRLRSLANDRTFAVGRFTTPSLAELRDPARAHVAPGAPRVTHEVVDDVLTLHARPENAGALFQVASQLNCLEFPGPGTTPEDGITGYARDPTQGPACALAAAAATVVRNYLVRLPGEPPVVGQRRDRQLDNLAGLAARLGPREAFWTVRNGYTFSDARRLAALREALAVHDRDALLGAVRIGLQEDVGVTFRERFVEPERGAEPRVSQAFCSAVSCAYAGLSRDAWEPLATLCLDACYEATLWAAARNARRAGGSPRVWLTLLGGGAFGNDPAWIVAAIRRALHALRDVELDVRIAHHRSLDRGLVDALETPAT